MPLFACLFLLAVFRDVTVLDQTYQIPPNDWRYVDSEEWRYPGPEWKERPAIVKADFTAGDGTPVRMMLMDRANLASFKRGESHREVRRTPPAQSASFEQRTPAPQDYVIVLENRSPQAASVHLHVKIDSWDATELTPERRLSVIAISFCVFFGVVTYSAARLLRAIKP